MPLSQSEKTSRTDDERVVSVDLLPPPEHLIRFFPIEGTPVETLVSETRSNIRQLLRGADDRLLYWIFVHRAHRE
jgi:3-deoxy-7-phosphoheptulonate synthase